MAELIPRPFSTPDEEVAFLREQLAKKERELLNSSAEAPARDEVMEKTGKETLVEYASFKPKAVLAKEQQLSEHEMASSVSQLETAHDRVADVLHIIDEKGIYNALSVVEKMGDAHLTDEVHRRLIEELRNGLRKQTVKENTPLWQLLHMTLFAVTLPDVNTQREKEVEFSALVGTMQQWFAGLQSLLSDSRNLHFVFEIAVSEHSDDIVFYVAVPNDYIVLFEKQTLSLFPWADIELQAHDYNIFVEGGESSISVATLEKHPIYPLRGQEGFQHDPLAVILNTFSKIEKDGGGAAVQFIIQPSRYSYAEQYQSIKDKVAKGMKPKEAIDRSTFGGDFMASVGEFVFSSVKNKKSDTSAEPTTIDQEALEKFQHKLSHPLVESGIRIVTSARQAQRAKQVRGEIESAFQQFSLPHSNAVMFKELRGRQAQAMYKAFSFREKETKYRLPLTTEELSTIVHFPVNGIEGTPQFRQAQAKTAPAPNDMPEEGTLLGINKHRNVEKEIYITPEDRLRHFYIIGQTGTGKTTLMKNMIRQDIASGAGVCMIDPHGTDIDDIVASVPENRVDDIVYFDPSRQDRVIGLNMLEYDINKPEQKTFVVNELFSIFQKLYRSTPEAMGPMFEQYFRNATLLVMEDPDSGNTLMDISRVLSDKAYRQYKLERANNPVVVQFWREIATKAGGEASLENIVPYIVSKFDVFTANDYLRPIIGQQQSSFNFRSLMDEQKILLVNLSKGRLGDINADLLGMIVVGKILMAALSRVDDSSKQFPPFYLHMDEFQNISTDSIATILSEARKYKLGLTMAHQFMAQLDPAIKDAVFGNVGSISAFRVGNEDAQVLEQQFAPVCSVHDLMSVPNRNAYMRILNNGTPTKPFSIQTVPPPAISAEVVAERIALSYMRYGRDRNQVEQEIRARYN